MSEVCEGSGSVCYQYNPEQLIALDIMETLGTGLALPMIEERNRPLAIIAGPTGSGKSTLALRIAEEFAGEVVNCDSIQVYRHFSFGAAKLSNEERRGIRHHLIDVVEPDDHFTAGDYSRKARRALGEISARGKLPVIAGGTGFYLRALLEGLFSGSVENMAVRRRLLERQGRRPGCLHRILTRLDPAAAEKIHRNDIHKTIRALEVRLMERRPITELFETGRNALRGFCTVKLILSPPRSALYRRLDERLAWMFGNGLIEETRSILDRGYSPTLKPFESLGYRQALGYLNGELSREEALAEAQMQTRRYAKRQVTWFRREKDAIWLEGFGGDLEIEQQALEIIGKSTSMFQSEL